MKDNIPSPHRTFLLTSSRVYVPGAQSKAVDEARDPSAGGCCGALAPAKASTGDDGPTAESSDCTANATDRQATLPVGCC